MVKSQTKWWQRAVFYQIYPRSFADGNGDGIGDLTGMIDRLDYLQDLGVQGLWLSPHYPSPNWDCGYDIADYENVAPEYGSLDDFKRFLDGAHARGMHVILDLVLNHTSDEHPWFLESRASRADPKADWYIWHDPVGSTPDDPQGQPPNNWQSCFDGPAWTYLPERGQYYYHYFMRQQPDLNWNNPDVRQAVWHAVRFWLDMGVDGFRLDALGTIFEDPAMTPHEVPMDLAQLRHMTDTARTPPQRKKLERYWFDMFKYQWGGPGLHDLMKELRGILDEYPGDRLLVGEDDNIDYMGNGEDELHLVFNFPLMRTERLTPPHIRANQAARLQRLDSLPVRGWACNTLGNHDCSRLITRYGDGQHNEQLARLHLALLLSLRGTPFLYNGEEIGMTDLLICEPVHLRDTMATWYYERMTRELSVEPVHAAQRAATMSRDKNRTPFQWSPAPNAGFCPQEISPWLPVNPDYLEGRNLQDQQSDPNSLFQFYRDLIRVRQGSPALMTGEYEPIHPSANKYLAYLRSAPSQKVLVVLNFSPRRLILDLPDLYARPARVLLSTGCTTQEEPVRLGIEPYGFIWTELT